MKRIQGVTDNGVEPTHLVIIHAFVTFDDARRIRKAMKRLGITDAVFVETFGNTEDSRRMIETVNAAAAMTT